MGLFDFFKNKENSEEDEVLKVIKNVTKRKKTRDNALDDFIFWERARELCFEGHAKFDIVRAGLDKFLAEVKGQEESVKVGDPSKTRTVSWSNNVQPYHLLFPIPAAEMSANPNMTQNDGY